MRLCDLKFTIEQTPGAADPDEAYIRFFIINSMGEKEQVFVEDFTYDKNENNVEILLG